MRLNVPVGKTVVAAILVNSNSCVQQPSARGRWYSTLPINHLNAREVSAIACQCHYVLCIIMFGSSAVISLQVKREHLPLWVPRRNASALQCWTCGGWPKNGIRASKSSAKLSGVTFLQSRCFRWYFVRAMFCLLLISVSNDEWSPFQLQIMPSTVTSHGDTEKESGGSLSNQTHPEAFPKEARQLFGGRIQPEAQVPHRAD